MLARLIGTLNQVSFAGRVVVLEEVGEPWYRSDRALTHLLNATDLPAGAVVWGEFVDCEEGSVTRFSGGCRRLGYPVGRALLLVTASVITLLFGASRCAVRAVTWSLSGVMA